MPRSRKPTALHLLENTLRAKRHADRALEAQPALGCAPPAWLSKRALVRWKEMAPALERNGLLTEADGAAFGSLCEALAEQVQLQKARQPVPVGLRVAIVTMYAHFGMTPSSRSKAAAAPKPEAKKPLDKYTGPRDVKAG